MSKYLESVEEFHKAFNHPIEPTIKEDNLKVRELRLKLLYEEIEELSNAMGTDETLHKLCEETLSKPINKDVYDKVETLDALCDTQYVLSGAILALGYTDIFNKAFDEVQRSNMSKMCLSNQEAKDTINYYKNERGESMNINITPKGDGFIVVRQDGKILKNVYYSEADLEQFIDG